MSFVAIIPLLVAIIGLLIYVLASNGKLVEVGRILFSCGTLVALFVFARTVLRIP